MKSSSSRLRRTLFLAFFLTVAASIHTWVNGNQPDDADVMPTKPNRTEIKKVAFIPQNENSDSRFIIQRVESKVSRDIFLVKEASIQEPPRISQAPLAVAPAPVPLAPQSAVPNAPVVPPLPFTYIGKLLEDGRYTVFLAGNGRNYAAKEGQTIAQVYRVEEIAPPSMTVTYIPMSIKQTLLIGEKN